MFGMSGTELIIVIVVALLVLGPKKLPDLARSAGKALREFRKATEGIRSTVEQEFYKMDQDVGLSDAFNGTEERPPNLGTGAKPAAPLPHPPPSTSVPLQPVPDAPTNPALAPALARAMTPGSAPEAAPAPTPAPETSPSPAPTGDKK